MSVWVAGGGLGRVAGLVVHRVHCVVHVSQVAIMSTVHVSRVPNVSSVHVSQVPRVLEVLLVQGCGPQLARHVVVVGGAGAVLGPPASNHPAVA